jgi:hypothetical protein
VAVVVRDDPVAARRARIAVLAALGKRIGYSLLATAVVTFFVGWATDFPSWTVTTTVAALATACVVLPLPIVFAYGVRAAEREEREQAQRRDTSRGDG